MTDSPLFFSSGQGGAVTVVTTAETVVATLAGVTTRWPGQVVKLTGSVVFTTGADTTGLKVRVRKQSLTGTLVSGEGTQAIVGAVAGSNAYGVYCENAPGDVTGYTYVLTVQAVDASANGAAVSANLTARVD